MSQYRLPNWALLSLIITLPLGCEKTPDAEKASAATPASSAQADPTPSATTKSGQNKKERRGKRGQRGGGVANALYSAALNEIGLSEEKVAELEKLKPERARDETQMAAAKGRQEALIAGIEAGKLDAAKFEANQTAMEKQRAEHLVGQQKLLNDLHSALDPAQRKAAVEIVRKAELARAERSKPKTKTDDAVGEDGTAEKAGPKKGGRGMRGGMSHGKSLGFERMLGRLDLDAAQQTKVDALKSKRETNRPSDAERERTREEMKKTTDAVLTAFESDTFDAAKLTLMPARKGPDAKQEVAHTNALLAILTAEQRTRLAEQMKRPGKGRGGRPGGRGKGGPMGGPGADDGLDAFDNFGGDSDWDSDDE